MKRATRYASVLLLTVFAGMAYYALSGAQGGNPTIRQSLSNATQLVKSVQLYAVDYDERLPPMQTATEFRDIVLSHAPDVAIFTCPETNSLFVPNAELSNLSFAAIDDPSSAWIIRSVPTGKEQKSIVGFLDGRIERGGTNIRPTSAIGVDNAHKLAWAIFGYTQDYDERLPLKLSQEAAQQALLPYLHTRRYFYSPETGQPFRFNENISGRGVWTLGYPGSVVTVFDRTPLTDPNAVVGFLDGHVERGGKNLDDLTQLTADRVKRLVIGMALYVQDYDETFPTMPDLPTFQQQIFPYVHNLDDFYSAITKQPFLPNFSLAGKPLAAIPPIDPALLPVVWDIPPQPGQNSFVGFFDGHVEYGGKPVESPPATNEHNLRLIHLATFMYSQDYDERFPPMDTQPEFEDAVSPYARAHRVFSNAMTGAPFIPNPEFSLFVLATADFSEKWFLRDQHAQPDGTSLFAYLDNLTLRIKRRKNFFNINGDATPDLLWQGESGQMTYGLLEGAKVKSVGVLSSPALRGYNLIVAADLNGDDKPDLILQNPDTGAILVRLMGGAKVTETASLATGLDANWELVAAPDLNTDGFNDLLFVNRTTGRIKCKLMHGLTEIGSGDIANDLDANWRLAATADLNRDGKPDFIWQNARSGAVLCWIMDGTQRAEALWIDRDVPAGLTVVGKTDLNHDGQPDLLLQTARSNAVTYWLMDGTRRGGSGLLEGAPPKIGRLIGLR